MMLKFEWKEENRCFEATLGKKIVVRVYKKKSHSEWEILEEGRWVRRGVCRDLDVAKYMASKEVEVYFDK